MPNKIPVSKFIGNYFKFRRCTSSTGMDNRMRDVIWMLARADSALSELLVWSMGPIKVVVNQWYLESSISSAKSKAGDIPIPFSNRIRYLDVHIWRSRLYNQHRSRTLWHQPPWLQKIQSSKEKRKNTIQETLENSMKQERKQCLNHGERKKTQR